LRFTHTHVWPTFLYIFPLAWHLLHLKLASQIAFLVWCTTARKPPSSTTDNFSFYHQTALCTRTLLPTDYKAKLSRAVSYYKFYTIFPFFIWMTFV
jgi:hypothetical protein